MRGELDGLRPGVGGLFGPPLAAPLVVLPDGAGQVFRSQVAGAGHAGVAVRVREAYAFVEQRFQPLKVRGLALRRNAPQVAVRDAEFPQLVIDGRRTPVAAARRPLGTRVTLGHWTPRF